MKHVVDIDSFATLQKVIEDYDLSEFGSITQFVIELLSSTFRSDHETVCINIDRSILPPSCYSCTAMWKKALKDRISYPYISFHKKYRGNTLHITATSNPENNTAVFKQRLINKIRTNKKVTFNRSSIPSSYQKQPYVILSRIKKELKIKIKIQRQTPKSITYVQVNNAQS